MGTVPDCWQKGTVMGVWEAVCAGGGDRGDGRYGFLAPAYCGWCRKIMAADTRDDEFGRAQK